MCQAFIEAMSDNLDAVILTGNTVHTVSATVSAT